MPQQFDLSNLPDKKKEEQGPQFDLSNLPDKKTAAPPEDEGMLSKAYHWFTDPLTTIPSDIAHTAGDAMTEHTLDESPTWAKVRGFGAGALQGIGDLASQATSPFSLLTALATGGSSVAASKGLPAIANALKYTGAALSAPVAAHGAYGVGRYAFDPSMTTPEFANAVTELAAGTGGMLGATKFGGARGKEGEVAKDLQRPIAEPTPPVVKTEVPAGEPIDQVTAAKEKAASANITAADASQAQGQQQEQPEGFVGASDAAQLTQPDQPDISELGEDLAGIAKKYPVIWLKKPSTSDIMKLMKRGYRVDPNIDPEKGVKMTLGTSASATAQQTGAVSGATPQNPIPAIPEDHSPLSVKVPSTETLQSLAKQGYFPTGERDANGFKFEYRAAQPEPPGSSSGLAKVGQGFQEVQGFVKSVMASNDLSAIRQAYPSITYKAFWTSLDDMVKAWGSQGAYDNGMKAIRENPLYKPTAGPNGTFGPSIGEKMGLDITDSLNRREEMYASQFADKYVPGVKRSERAYTLFLNKIRTDNYQHLLESSGAMNKDGIIVNEPLAKELATFVNDATGRGDLGALEKHAKLLNSMFFSPRLMASRINIMTKPLTYMNMPAYVRQQYMRSLLGVVGVGTAVSELVNQAGNMLSPGSVSVSHNPTNPDFMKIKVGDTRVDPFFGFQQPVVLAAKALMGQTTSSTSGKTRNLYSPNLGENVFGQQAIHQKSPFDPTMLSTVMNYGRTKLDPTLGFAVSLLDAATEPGGQKMQFGFDTKHPIDSTFNNSVAQRFIPMVMQDIYAIANDEPGLLPGLMMGAGTIFGAGTQTYGGRPNVPK